MIIKYIRILPVIKIVVSCVLAAVAARFGKEETRKSFDVIQRKLNQKCRDKDKSGSAADKENIFKSLDL